MARFWNLRVWWVLVWIGAGSGWAQDLPDLTVSDDPSGPASVLRGQDGTLSVEILNQGGLPTSGAFGVTVYLSSDAAPADKKVGDVAVSAFVGAGERRPVEVPFKIPALQAYGSYFWTVKVDAEGLITEADETNNVKAGPVVLVTPPPPDLWIESGPSGPVNVARGGNYTVSVHLQNSGEGPTLAPFDVTVYLSEDEFPGNADDVSVGAATVSAAVVSGESRPVSIPVSVPFEQGFGTYRWVAVVDAGQAAVETDETNNTAVGHSFLLVQQLSDLIVLESPSGPNRVVQNGIYSVSLNVQNQGVGNTTGAFNVTVYLGGGGGGNGGDVRVGNTTVTEALASGGSKALSVPVILPDSQDLGAYRWVAVVDAGDLEAESDETNNRGIGNAVSVVLPPPDLLVSTVPSGPAAVHRGEDYTVFLEVKNQGGGPTSDPFDVVVYLSEDLTAGNGDDVRLGDMAVTGVVEAGSGEAIGISVKIPALQALRSYYWVAVVDDGGFVEETDENNNGLTGHAVSIVPSPPDLAFSADLSGPTQVMQDEIYTISLELQNRGAGSTTGAFQATVYLSADSLFGNGDDVRVGNLTVTEVMGAQASRPLQVAVTVPSEQAFGEYHWVAVVDVGNLEAELDEGNNVRVAGRVRVVPAPPDLTVLADPIGPRQLFKGEVDTVSLQIRNRGEGPAGGTFEVAVYLSADEVSGNEDDVKVGKVQITEGIEAGASLEVKVPMRVPQEQALGAYRWVAAVDIAGGLSERDETNNLRIGGVGISVVPFLSDLIVLTDLIGPGQVARGGLYSVPVSVLNLGRGPADGGVQVAVYLSQDRTVGNADDVLAGHAEISETLAPGASRTVEVPVIVPKDQEVGTYRWVARVNVGGLVEESDEGNNTRLGNEVTFPVLALEPGVLAFGPVRVGESRSLTFEVANGGTAKLSFGIESTDGQVTTSSSRVEDLPSGVRWPVTVTFTPTRDGALDSELRIWSNDTETGRVVKLGGTGVAPLADRVYFDFDPTPGNQGRTALKAGAGQAIPMELYVAELPEVREVRIQVAFDTLLVSYVEGSWEAGSFIQGAAVLGAEFVAPGLLELRVNGADAASGSGGGHLGNLMVQTRPAFRDSTAGGSQTVLQSVQLLYLPKEGTQEALQVQMEATLVFASVCWADFNSDGQVGLPDFLTFTEAFDRTSESPGWDGSDGLLLHMPYRRFDGNGDGQVNLTDFLMFTEVYGRSCDPFLP